MDPNVPNHVTVIIMQLVTTLLVPAHAHLVGLEQNVTRNVPLVHLEKIVPAIVLARMVVHAIMLMGLAFVLRATRV